MKNRLIIALLIALIIMLSVFIINTKLNAVVMEKQVHDTIHSVQWVDDSHVTHSTISNDNVGNNNVIHKTHSYIMDTLAKALKIAREQVTEYQRITATLEGQLKAETIRADENSNVATLYRNKYMTIITSSIDSTVKYRYDAVVDVVHYEKKKWFLGNDRHFIDVSSPDTSFRINGLTHYKKNYSNKKDFLSIGIETDLQIGLKGQEINQVRTGINMHLNPDGFVTPNFGYGYQYDLYKGGRFVPYIKAGVGLNFIRF